MGKREKFKADGTVAGCFGTGRPIWPNKCEDCEKHSDFSCKNVKKRVKNESH
jgi:hypothetical protein